MPLLKSVPYNGDGQKSVLAQLNRIVDHELFVNSPILCKFLRFIVEETLLGNSGVLKEYTIGIRALGKKDEFNPQTDPIVRIHAGRLRRVLEQYYAGPGVKDKVVIEVVKGSYVPIFRNVVGHDKTGEFEGSEKSTAHHRAKLTLAVLPFRNLSPDNSYQFFADGLGEELTSLFSSYQDFSIVAHHSARKYISPEYDIKVIGSELGAHYLIIGSVRRTDQEIRINVGLAETVDGKQIWSKSYCHTLKDSYIEIQDHIVTDAYSILGGHYGFIVRDAAASGKSRSSVNLYVFDAVLWNYHFHINFSKEAYLETRRALENALKRNPNYATGMAILSELYMDAYTLGYPTVDDPVHVGYDMAKKAVSLEPGNQHAQRSYAWANIYLKKKQEALQAMERCLELNPSSISTVGTIGFGMACVGEYSRAYELLNRARLLNPHCPWWFYLGYYLVYYSAGEYEKALEAAEKITPSDVFFNPLTKAAAKGKLGMVSEATNDNLRINTDFQPVLIDIRTHLGTFILDNQLIDEIIDGMVLAGLQLEEFKHVK